VTEYPYTVEELRGASKQPPDEYHRHLMVWAADRIEELQRALAAQQEPAQ
jgi:hypothetical protein